MVKIIDSSFLAGDQKLTPRAQLFPSNELDFWKLYCQVAVNTAKWVS